MAENADIRGACNCGQITVSIAKDLFPNSCSLCHCLNCQISGGSLYVHTPQVSYWLFDLLMDREKLDFQ